MVQLSTNSVWARRRSSGGRYGTDSYPGTAACAGCDGSRVQGLFEIDTAEADAIDDVADSGSADGAVETEDAATEIACVPEDDAALCARLGRDCDVALADDNCGLARSVDCGACPAGEICGTFSAGVCDCPPETNQAFCARAGRVCGPFEGVDDERERGGGHAFVVVPAVAAAGGFEITCVGHAE